MKEQQEEYYLYIRQYKVRIKRKSESGEIELSVLKSSHKNMQGNCQVFKKITKGCKGED